MKKYSELWCGYSLGFFLNKICNLYTLAFMHSLSNPMEFGMHR